MSVNLNYAKASDANGEAVAGSVTAKRAVDSTTLKVDSVLNWPSYFIATTGVVQSDDTLDPTSATVFKGHLSGSDIIIDSFSPGYTDVGNSVDDVVLIKPNTPWANEIVNVIEVAHNEDGTPKPLVDSQTSTKTLTPDLSSNNQYRINALADDLTIKAPTSTPDDGKVMIISITDNGTSRSITWNSIYVNISGLDDLTSTIASKTSVVGLKYNSYKTKWEICSITTEG